MSWPFAARKWGTNGARIALYYSDFAFHRQETRRANSRHDMPNHSYSNSVRPILGKSGGFARSALGDLVGDCDLLQTVVNSDHLHDSGLAGSGFWRNHGPTDVDRSLRSYNDLAGRNGSGRCRDATMLRDIPVGSSSRCSAAREVLLSRCTLAGGSHRTIDPMP